MEALFLGLLAALLWGLHDFTVRVVGGRVEPLVLLLGVLLSGAVVLAPVAAGGDWVALDARAWGLAVLAGVTYTGAAYGLYRAFGIGPVYLVAPICGAFPMISVALEGARGNPAGMVAWVGALVVLGGIALVARSSEEGAAGGGRAEAIGWAVLACLGFSFTFALSQWASEGGGHLPVALVARVSAAALVVVLIAVFRPEVAPTLRAWKPMLLMGLLDVGALTSVTLAGGMRNAEYASVAASIFGMVTILLAWRFLGERLGPVQWLGCGLVFAGIVALGLTGHGGHG
ncbi:DMT family transporter [Paragemmobacter straminiformis]|uniref:DMT family transporter n=1 Tax=Paragemmobacter straminiformis TaxID=2045119 RepID=A0A842I744_9RHOB|nr:DMT family transporter [Gemmobacter straminiformis]MBC2835670.1 DMT family transporter [Gemmobacter straminiformis]